MFIQIDGSTACIAQPVGGVVQAVRGATACQRQEGVGEVPGIPAGSTGYGVGPGGREKTL
jgi:hypothetical protein